MHFEEDIKPLFREGDREAMRFAFDLWSLDDVSTHADAILDRLEAGTMPCDGAWPAERVAVFRRWIDAGKPAVGRRWQGPSSASSAMDALGVSRGCAPSHARRR